MFSWFNKNKGKVGHKVEHPKDNAQYKNGIKLGLYVNKNLDRNNPFAKKQYSVYVKDVKDDYVLYSIGDEFKKDGLFANESMKANDFLRIYEVKNKTEKEIWDDIKWV